MLVLTRKAGESIIVEFSDGSTFRITIVAIRENRVRIGFEAPPQITIIREEVLYRKDANPE